MRQLAKYYQTLGVPTGSPKSVVKKAYWKLAKRYHPDVNPSHQANQKFLEITVAYEAIVEGKVPKEAPIAPPTTAVKDPFEKYKDVYQPPKDPVAYAEWLEVAKKRAEELSAKQYRHLQGYIKYLEGVRKALFYPSVVTALLAFFFIVDSFMPLESTMIEVEEVHRNGVVYLEDGSSFRAGRDVYYSMSSQTNLLISRSPFIGVIQQFGVVNEEYVMTYELQEHFYLWGGLYNYLLLVFSLAMLMRIRFITGNFFALYFIVIFWGLVQWWWY